MPKKPKPKNKPIKMRAGEIIRKRLIFTPKIGLNLGMNPPPNPT